MKKTFLQVISCTLGLAWAVSSCAPETEQMSPFYAELYRMMDSGKYSPLRVARPEGKSGFSGLDFSRKGEMLSLSSKDGEISLLLSPFSVMMRQQAHTTEVKYSIELIYRDGTRKRVTSLSAPEISGNTCRFRTDVADAGIRCTAYKDFLEWDIEYSGRTEVDSVSLSVDSRTPFYGGGERFKSSRLSGRTITNQPNDHFLAAHTLNDRDLKNYEPSYMQIPFYITPEGYGLYIDEAASLTASFKRGTGSMDVAVKGGNLNFYTIMKSSPKEALEVYTALSGRQPELPDWAFGLWVNLLEGRDSVYRKAALLKEWGIPATAVWLFDLDDPATSTGWTQWTHGYYGNSRQLTDSLHRMGFKVLTYLRPFADKKLFHYKFDNPKFHEFDSLGLLLRAQHFNVGKRTHRNFKPVGQYDFLHPAMYEAWKDVLSEILQEDGFDGWMEDFGDLCYAYNMVEKKWEPLDFGLDYPLTLNEYANTYPLLYHKLTYGIASGIEKDFVGFCRSGSAGSAGFSKLMWGGDQMPTWDKNSGYPSAIVAGISSGLSGYGQWTPDLLCGSPSRVLWKRWVQFSAFTMLMREHSWSNKKNSVNMWTDKETLDYYKAYTRMHTDLKPYLLSLAEEYQKSGCPVMRHMFLEYPEDKETYGCEYQYMLGSRLLVAPVVEENAVERRLYLPEGQWRYYWTGKVYEGKGWVTVDAPDNWIPLFIKEGNGAEQLLSFFKALEPFR